LPTTLELTDKSNNYIQVTELSIGIEICF
jgi:hypothetical protein